MTGLRAFLIAVAIAAATVFVVWGVTHGDGDWGSVPASDQYP